jgi:cytochrome c oxidase assembly protein subunit 15
MEREVQGRVHQRSVITREAGLVADSFQRRAIRLWLLTIAGFIVVGVVVGGATRLTQAGLSIVEWKPITGVVPPLSDAQWQAEFEKYRGIPQYRILNHAMTLGEFKTIYWWEWAHRLLGRMIGAVFLLPLLWFTWRGWVGPTLRSRLWLIFGLGTLQGLVGWWMVASGLADRTEVSQYRLATHLVLACVIFGATLWTAQGLVLRARIEAPLRIRATAPGLLVLVLVQLYLGALLAGLRGGLIYNTWPLLEGSLVPSATELLSLSPAWRNVFENILTVQFLHRMIAYIVWLVAVCHVLDVAAGSARPLLYSAVALAAAVTLQAVLGIVTLLNRAPLPLALAHQAMAMVVLTLAVMHAESLSGKAAGMRLAAPATHFS